MSELAMKGVIQLPAGALGRKNAGWWALVGAIGSEAALFAYLLFAYYYCVVEIGHEFVGKPPSLRLALPDTIVLLVSSLTVWLGERSVCRGARGAALLWLLVTIVLGAAFVAVQLFEWKAKTFTLHTDAYSSLYFTTTGFHMAHVAAGLVALLLAFAWCALGYFSPRRHVPMMIVSAYWHFVDAVWLCVFFSYYIAPRLWQP
jgi:heme/copper-type cytochrome/quinol oxidase subunit 3